jgi:uncharacterized OsmC-like protein
MAKEIFIASTEMNMKKGLQVTCSARGKSFILDEPKEFGGIDEGMNPVEAMLSALGACKCIVVKSFARMNKINLQGIRIECEGELDPDGFLGKNKNAKIGFSKIKTNYYFESTNTKEELMDFIDFVERTCPVKDSIVNSPEMENELHY